MSATEMSKLDALLREAEVTESGAYQDARRQMAVCNACRYCEGYCAVFPAMAARREFATADLTHLANLCHGCKGCYHACQYAPPHAFAINIPATFATIRQESYAQYAWPPAMGRAFEKNGTVVVAVATLFVTLALLLAVALVDPSRLWTAQTGTGAFFRIIPLWLINTLAGASFGFAILAMAMGALRYLKGTGGLGGPIAPAPVADAAVDVLTLRNLGGGGHGCNDVDDSFAQQRRWLHQAMFYGFMLCFAATTTGAIYHHVFGWKSPHAFLSLPVQLGTWGGVLLCIGTAGLMRVKVITDPVPVARKLLGGEFAMLGLLFLIGSTGLLLLAVRHTGAMGCMLALHFGLVLALFVVLPYSKMVHGVYRGIALLRNARERRARG
ncbi:tricarballylate utilization 4Fe-4S protein TcuB [Falsiroseomonas stagni]|uniref:Citrate/tricarballylate utilization protein n=1 Tax=Falsiroseomonas stagni DSM 19981 TaxID=1123062 RepID=A0A1I4BPV6_9PROT|nr:tricarballylate utilization 4Fe-4S protein TcuB [Falsiroseomonas stagni]SFK70872.1 citrate/tricarballylate utilization protein [Falsiroseomonas stagni DSM 19981]